MTESLGKKTAAAFLQKLTSSPRKADSPGSLSKSKSLKNKHDQVISLKKKSAEGRIPLDSIDWSQSPSSPKERLDGNASDTVQSPIPVRRASVKHVNPHVKTGTLLLKIPEIKSQIKPTREQKVIYCVASVLGCTLTTSFQQYAPCVNFSEIFEFPVYGDFVVKLEVFVQTEKRNENKKFEMPESLGTLTFERLSVVQVEKLTGVYFLKKEEEDTTNSITLNLAIKIDQAEEVDRTKLPSPDYVGQISRQVPTGESYSWVISECELRGRTLTFYSDNKKVKVLEIDPKSKAKRPETEENEEVFPYHCFQVLVKSKPVYLVAQSKEMMNEWISKINKAITSPF
jgi:hypothetical protein